MTICQGLRFAHFAHCAPHFASRSPSGAQRWSANQRRSPSPVTTFSMTYDSNCVGDLPVRGLVSLAGRFTQIGPSVGSSTSDAVSDSRQNQLVVPLREKESDRDDRSPIGRLKQPVIACAVHRQTRERLLERHRRITGARRRAHLRGLCDIGATCRCHHRDHRRDTRFHCPPPSSSADVRACASPTSYTARRISLPDRHRESNAGRRANDVRRHRSRRSP